MRRRTVVATAALIAALALAGLPVPAGSRTTPDLRAVELAAFSTVTTPAVFAPASTAPGALDAAFDSAGRVSDGSPFVEPGAAPTIPATRPKVSQPSDAAGSAWKKPQYSISGYATFYDNGTTAMRLPRGTVVRICGKGGCIERTVTDYGPQKPIRIVDLYRPDFFRICGCPSWAGTTWVTVSVY